MIDYKDPYFALFNALTGAIESIEAGKYEDAWMRLICAQQTGEELVTSQDDRDDR
jgi:hypothetical protein